MKKLFVLPGMILLLLAAFAGCRKKKPDSGEELTRQPGNVSVSAAPYETITPIETTEIPIYTISADQKELVAVTALVTKGQEVNEQIVAETVADALADSAFYVEVNQVFVQNGRVTVDFDSAAPPAAKVSRELEELILDAFAQSMIDNIADCNEVSFWTDGKPYKSSHITMEEDSVYLRR